MGKKTKPYLGFDKAAPDPLVVWMHLTAEEHAWLKQMRAARTCARKVAHETKEDCMKAALGRMLSVADLKLWPYQCLICNKWHLTSRKTKD